MPMAVPEVLMEIAKEYQLLPLQLPNLSPSVE